MIGFLQRVSQASVTVDAEEVASIAAGLLILVCAERGDTPEQVKQLLTKIVHYRVFGDKDGKMNLSLLQMAELSQNDNPAQRLGLLLVPQFTLAADTRSGTRPSFTPAAPPEQGRALFELLVEQARACYGPVIEVQGAVFGADMKVRLCNDGPVSFWLETRKMSTS